MTRLRKWQTCHACKTPIQFISLPGYGPGQNYCSKGYLEGDPDTGEYRLDGHGRFVEHEPRWCSTIPDGEFQRDDTAGFIDDSA